MKLPIMFRVIKAILFLSIGASADILVQPGYGQPHPAVQSYASAPTHPAVQSYASAPTPVVKQPSSTPLASNTYQLSSLPYGQQSVAPYYLEVQPIYVDQSQAQSQIVGYPHWHHPHMSPLPPRHIPHHHLHYSKIGGYSVVRPSVFVGQPQVPLAAHNRRRRSTDGGSVSGGKAATNKNNDVAKDSTLIDGLSPINFADNQDNEHTKDLNDKYMEARQSKNAQDITGATLLGLNPARMQPAYHEHLSEDDPHQSQTRHIGTRHKAAHHSPTEIVGQQMKSQQPTQTSIPERQNDEQVRSSPNWRIITPEGQTLELAPTSLRNFPDPRPISPKKDKIVLQMANPSDPNNEDTSNDDPIVGTTAKLHNKLARLHALKQHHHHSLPMALPPAPTNYAHYDTPPTYPTCSCPSNPPTPSYVVHQNNAGCYNGLQTTVQPSQPASSLYQVSYAPQTSAPSTSYVILPQSNSQCNTAYSYGNTAPLTYYV